MGEFFRADRSWTDRPVVIVGGGASLDIRDVRLIGLARARELVRVIAINDAIYLCGFADIGYACDRKWWNYHGPLPWFGGLKLSLEETPFRDVMQLKNGGKEGFDPDRGTLRTGGNGGYQAVHLAVHLGAPKILLVAFDMKGEHWFGKHPAILSGASPSTKVWIEQFGKLAKILKTMNVEVINASRESALECFPRGDLGTEITSLEPGHG